MTAFVESILSLAVAFCFMLLIYSLFLRQRILTRGATREEINMSMPGDDQGGHISSTRAIAINAPAAKVWQWVIQLGADRGGFFSYEFLERLLGYKMGTPLSSPEYTDLEVGRIIPTSLNESGKDEKYNFEVISVKPEEYLTLKNWGTIYLKKINPEETRLIIRTNLPKPQNFLQKVSEFFFEGAHYLMERRMQMGFKAQIENGRPLSEARDNLWILGLVLSAAGIICLAFLSSGIAGGLLVTAFSTAWLLALLIWMSAPEVSLGLLLVILIANGLYLV